MELAKQVVCRELSQRLKELGVNKESLFQWCRHQHTGGADYWHLEYSNLESGLTSCGAEQVERIDAYTTSELGEILPEKYKSGYLTCQLCYGWEVGYEHSVDDKPNNVIISIGDKTLANAMAKMLCWLVENKKLEVI